jgi:hypothetical protein
LLDSCDPISEPLSKLLVFLDAGCHALMASLPASILLLNNGR